MFKILLVSLVALTACTTLAPGAADVTVTRDAATVTTCKALGSVHSVPPYILPNDDLKQIKNRSIGMGADTVLITGPRLISTAGVAYRCKA
jgi:hypothetical protein